MNNLKARVITIAATIALAATAASAQQATVKATVPFPFTAGWNTVMQAGTYTIPASSDHYWRLIDNGTGHSVFVNGTETQSKATDQPALVFECHSSQCALREIRTGNGGYGYAVPAPRRGKGESDQQARVVVVSATIAAE
jgi:hypothetical protein